MDKKVTIVEVGPRDGLQNETLKVATKDKARYIELLGKSGLKNIEITSFVKPGAIPQLSDASELINQITFDPQISYCALVPNTRGLEAAMQTDIKQIAVFTAASNSFTKKNINATVDESLEKIKLITKIAHKNKIKIRGYISTIVECPYEGMIDPLNVKEITQRLLDLGIYQISLGETIGTAVPNDISRLLEIICKDINPTRLAGHYHDTRATALANVYRSIDFGIRSFDSSSAGLGGCPYAPGAAGNLATEDLVYALERSGFDTGINLEKLALASDFILEKLGQRSRSRVHLALLATKKRNLH